jgi:excisionase family DNA binding protein
MNKTEVAAELECSTRQVEKYAAENRLGGVEYVRGKRGREARYTEAAVASLRAELEGERQEVIGRAPAQALERQPGAEGMAILVSAIKDALRGAQTPGNGRRDATLTVELKDKLALNLSEAARVSGLSANHLRGAIHEGKLKAKIVGRGWKIAPDALKTYVGKVLK